MKNILSTHYISSISYKLLIKLCENLNEVNKQIDNYTLRLVTGFLFWV